MPAKSKPGLTPFGEALVRHGVSRQAAAKAMDTDTGTIDKYKNGTREISKAALGAVLKLCQDHHISPYEILGWSEPSKQPAVADLPGSIEAEVADLREDVDDLCGVLDLLEQLALSRGVALESLPGWNDTLQRLRRKREPPS